MAKQAVSRIALALLVSSASASAYAEHSSISPERSELPETGARERDDVLVASRDARSALGASEANEPPASKRVDLSRFSNGPRWVPVPRGRALARATELGIGTHEATIKLLRNGPSEALRAAVPGERPKTLLWPVPGGHPGRGFGFTRRVRSELRHNGIDIGASAGSAVRAAEAGLVVYSDNTLSGYGNTVIVLHAGGLMTLYAHNLRNTVQPGWYVERGERIALLGATGYAWGPHLHFELRDGFRPRDPAPLIRGFHSEELAGPLAELEPALEPEAAEPARTGPAATAAREPEAQPDTQAGEPQPASEPGRTFRTLLFPVKGGDVARAFHARRHPALSLSASAGAGVRATVDGIVTYSGPARRGQGDPRTERSIVLMHADGTQSTYTGALSEPIESGARVLRGQWLGRLAGDGRDAPELRFMWQRDGAAMDPEPILVGR